MIIVDGKKVSLVIIHIDKSYWLLYTDFQPVPFMYLVIIGCNCFTVILLHFQVGDRIIST